LIIITQKQLSVLAIDQIVMVGSSRITRTLAAIFAVRLLQAASAEVAEEVCTPTSAKGAADFEDCTPSPERGTELIQRAKRASLAGQGRLHAKQNRSDLESTRRRRKHFYCWEYDHGSSNGARSACWARKPHRYTSDCTPYSGETPCRCSTAECRLDLLSSATPTTAECAKKALYILGGRYSRSLEDSVRQVRGTGLQMYCLDMVKNTKWSAKHLVKRPEDPPEKADYPKWNCWWGSYMWKDGDNGCFRKPRYLGEKCWDWGDCAGSAGTSELLTSCEDGTCVPRGWKPRTPCACDWGPWGPKDDALVCNSGSCGGGACLMSLDGDGRYCDFGEWKSDLDGGKYYRR